MTDHPPAQPPQVAEIPSPRLRTRMLLMVFLVGTLVGCDQASKYYAQSNWKGVPTQSYFHDLLRIQYAENQGAFLSLLGDQSPRMRFWLLTVGNFAALAWVAGFLLLRRRIDYVSLAAFLLILAGGIGNLIDRARLDGIVVDFLIIDVGWGGLRTGIFNVADMAITAGALLLLPQIFRREPNPSESVS